ncbi:hypothetical protein MRX96_055814 [Rhipicephalus microplus]
MCRGAESTNASGDALSNETAAAEALASAAAGLLDRHQLRDGLQDSVRRRMRTVTNVFLLNLAVSDLLLGVFCMPTTLVGSVLRNFVLGPVMCKLIPYFQARTLVPATHAIHTVRGAERPVYLDDIIVAEKRNDTSVLLQVFQQLRENNLNLNKAKCRFREAISSTRRAFAPCKTTRRRIY